MPVGAAHPEVGIPNPEILELLKEKWPGLEPDASIHGNVPAVYYKLPGQTGGIGLISAMHGKFCEYCNRVRLTSQGQLKPCLSYESGTDLVPFLKGTDDELREALREAILKKPEAHCFDNMDQTADAHAEHRLMSQIGG
jgi:cyclic pyranopterin phosphate synthase